MTRPRSGRTPTRLSSSCAPHPSSHRAPVRRWGAGTGSILSVGATAVTQQLHVDMQRANQTLGATGRTHTGGRRPAGHERRPLRAAHRLGAHALAIDNYPVVLLLIVLSILVTAA